MGCAASSAGGPYYGNDVGPDGPLARRGVVGYTRWGFYIFLLDELYIRNIYLVITLYIPENIPGIPYHQYKYRMHKQVS